MKDYLAQSFADHQQLADRTLEVVGDSILEAAQVLVDCFHRGNKLLLFGNGGSAADAQHIAAEFVGRFELPRDGYAAIALTTDTSALTSISNDFGYSMVFSRQVQALARPGDVLGALSTSGSSSNVIEALRVGREHGCLAIGWMGRTGGEMAALCDVRMKVPSQSPQRVQEMHILIGHVLCGLVERSRQVS